MTDRDRIYVAACKLPPSLERDVIIDGIVRAWRQERQPASTRRRIVVDHFRQVLRAVEQDRAMPVDGFNYTADNRYLRDDWIDAERSNHAELLAAEGVELIA